MNSTSWTKEKINSISNKSLKKDFPSLLSEWFIANEMNLNPLNNSTCELCGQSKLYYEYFISNKLNNNKMLVGSVCINLFFVKTDKISVLANDELLDLNKSEMRKHLDKLFIKEVLSNIDSKIIEANISDWERNEFYPSVKQKIINREKLSPKQGIIFLKIVSKIVNQEEDVLKKMGNLMKIDLMRKKYKEQLNNLDLEKTSFLRYALTKRQIESFGEK